MLLAYYISKFFDFLAENFRRAAKFLKVRAEVQDAPPDDKRDTSPPAHWLELVQHIPPEQWMNFSGDSAASAMPVSRETKPTVRKSTVFSKSNPAVKEQNEDFQAQKSENERHKNFEISVKDETQTEKRKNKKSFLSFKVADKKTPVEKAGFFQPEEKSTQNSADRREKIISESKRKFRLFSTSKGEAQKTKTHVSDEVESLPVQSKKLMPFERETSAEFIQKKQFEKTAEPSAPVTEKKQEKEKRTGDGFDFQKRYSFQNESGKSKTTETGFNYAKGECQNHFEFVPVKRTETQTPEMFQVKEKSAHRAAEVQKLSYRRKEKETLEDKILAAQPWVELPDEYLTEEFEEAETRLFEKEHLLYLEREQRGN